MSSINTLLNSSTASDSVSTNKYNDLGAEDFLKLIVAELQSQDPLSPMDNTQMISQLSQIRSITSNDKLAETLESVALGQSAALASAMIGKTISGTSTTGDFVSGKVDRILFENGSPTLKVGEYSVKPDKITEVSSS